MAPINRRFFLLAPPAAAVAAASWFSDPIDGLEALDVPPLAGAFHASGAPVKGFRFAQLEGSVTVIHALASWRPECADEVAMWLELRGDPRFQIAGVFVRDSEAAARDFIARVGNPYDALGFDPDGRVERQLGVREAPSTVVLAPGRQIIHVARGPLTREHLKRTVLPIIDGASPVTALMA